MVPNILVCSADGRPHRWAHWQDSVTLKYKNQIAWEYGSHTFTFFGGVSRLTGEQSSITIPSIIGVKNKTLKRPKTPALTASNLFRRDRYLCAYCGRLCKGDQATIDHIVPSSRGGEHIWTNVVCACRKCNSYKSNYLLHEVNLELLYVPYQPNFEESLILRNRNLLADQMEFLEQFLPDHSRARGIVKEQDLHYS